MTFALNTSHPLYDHVKMFIGVDESNALVDLVTPSRTFTPDVSTPGPASFGTGTWGRHFRTGGNGPYDARGAAMSPAFNPGNNTGTLLVVTHGMFGGQNNGYNQLSGFVSIANGNSLRIPNFYTETWGSNLVAGIDEAGTSLTRSTGVSANTNADHMFTVTRNGETAHAVFVDDASVSSGGRFGYDTTVAGDISFVRLGGTPGYASFDAEIVYVIWFDIALTPTQVSDLFGSLGASNAFALLGSGGGSSPGVITITDVYDFTTAALKTSQTGVTAIINNPTTGALVVKLTGLTTTAGADMTITDVALVAATSYRVTLIFADGSEGTWVFAAS